MRPNWKSRITRLESKKLKTATKEVFTIQDVIPLWVQRGNLPIFIGSNLSKPGGEYLNSNNVYRQVSLRNIHIECKIVPEYLVLVSASRANNELEVTSPLLHGAPADQEDKHETNQVDMPITISTETELPVVVVTSNCVPMITECVQMPKRTKQILPR